ncbi:toxin [Pseudomonas sp. NFXW11]|uniref:toxin n=1 Tax=Pseudomonas sp. NFXW11 TaxID=2819531 RepID=UPI003CEA5C08
MNALFIELPAFQRHRKDFLDDELFCELQIELLRHPHAGDLIQGTGGLRKMRFVDDRRHKGKRGGLRVIYYWWSGAAQFWLFTLFDKDQMDDLQPQQRQRLKQLLEYEIEARKAYET